MAVPKFSVSENSFHNELRVRINNYFEQKKVKMTGNYKLYLKAVILICSIILIYTHVVFFTPNVFFVVLESILLGVLVAGIGFNIMHDGSHGSFSSHKWINTVSAYTVNVLGANSFLWNMKHNVIHHTYTNIDGVDDDIDVGIFMRMSKTQKKYMMHKYQHYYFWILYSFLYILWIFVLDYIKYFRGSIGEIKINNMKLNDHIVFWLFKALHLFLFIGLPLYFLGIKLFLVYFLVMTLVAGFVLSIVFQLAHTVEDTHFPQADLKSGKMEDEWAVHQLKTTANFATKNKLVSWFVGGLNFQIEHHLFPKISHIHYPAISDIIRQTCKEFGIEYIEYPKVRYAIASHVNHLKAMGNGA